MNENDLLPEDEPVPETLDDLLRREPCWHDVRSGLGRLLFGYLFWIVASFFCGAHALHDAEPGNAIPSLL